MENKKIENQNSEGQVLDDVLLTDYFIEDNCNESVQTFEELNLKESLLKGINSFGFIKPSLVQQKAILAIMRGKDVLCQSQSGSGKTGAIIIGALALCDISVNKVQAVILCATREVSIGISGYIKSIAQNSGIKLHVFTGATHPREDKKTIQECGHIVIGTIRRICDLLKRGYLDSKYLKVLLIDEIDEFIGRGFLDQVNEVLKLLQPKTQIAIFFSRIELQIKKITEDFLKNPVKILIRNKDLTLKGIKQLCICCSSDEVKFENLIEIFTQIDVNQCIIYCNTSNQVELLVEKLRQEKFLASCMHAKMSHEERNKTINEFTAGTSRILVSTDL